MKEAPDPSGAVNTDLYGSLRILRDLASLQELRQPLVTHEDLPGALLAPDPPDAGHAAGFYEEICQTKADLRPLREGLHGHTSLPSSGQGCIGSARSKGSDNPSID